MVASSGGSAICWSTSTISPCNILSTTSPFLTFHNHGVEFWIIPFFFYPHVGLGIAYSLLASLILYWRGCQHLPGLPSFSHPPCSGKTFKFDPISYLVVLATVRFSNLWTYSVAFRVWLISKKDGGRLSPLMAAARYPDLLHYASLPFPSLSPPFPLPSPCLPPAFPLSSPSLPFPSPLPFPHFCLIKKDTPFTSEFDLQHEGRTTNRQLPNRAHWPT